MMVPSFEPQPTTQPLSCKCRLERGSSQIWGGRMGGCHFLALTWCRREARQDELSVKPVRAPAMGAYVQIWGLKGCSLTEQIQSFTERDT